MLRLLAQRCSSLGVVTIGSVSKRSGKVSAMVLIREISDLFWFLAQKKLRDLIPELYL